MMMIMMMVLVLPVMRMGVMKQRVKMIPMIPKWQPNPLGITPSAANLRKWIPWNDYIKFL